jgi:hypothetical protein
MLLIGIWINFTKKPMNPIMANPIAVAMAIFWNSEFRDTKFTLTFCTVKIWGKNYQ